MTVSVNLTMSGAELKRPGRAPLMAYSAMADDHVVHAGVFDPEQADIPERANAGGAKHAVHSNDRG